MGSGGGAGDFREGGTGVVTPAARGHPREGLEGQLGKALRGEF